MSESDPRYYDISYREQTGYDHSMTTPTLNINYFFTDAAKPNIELLAKDKNAKFKKMESNIENQVYEMTRQECQ